MNNGSKIYTFLDKLLTGNKSFWVNIILIITLWLFAFGQNELFQYMIEFGTIIYLGLFITFNFREPYNASSVLLLVFGMLFIIVIFFMPHLDLNTNNKKQYQGYLGHLIKTGNYHRATGVYLRYECGDSNRTFTRDVPAPYGYNKDASDYRISRDLQYAVISPDGKVLEKKVDLKRIKKYTNRVLYSREKYVEFGNDSYEYAKYERDISYKNFGFNLVFTTIDVGDMLEVSWFNRGSKYLEKTSEFETHNQDTFLVYSNINPDFYDGWHICADSICTPDNIAKIDSAGYGYLFRGKIYSAAETEKYWNIIEQYKLRH